MILTHEFRVQAHVADTWSVVTDIPRVAQCLPGAALESSDGAIHRGRLSAKVGPISATYAGTATVLEMDDDTRTVVLQLEAQEVRGQGRATAVLTIRMADASGGTHIDVETDLQMTGPHAQFGRGILQSVAGKVIASFAENLEAEITAVETPSPADQDAEAPVAGDAQTVAGHPSAGGAGPLDVTSILPTPSPVELARASAVLVAGVVLGALWRAVLRPGVARSQAGGTTVHIHLGSSSDRT